MIAIDRDLAARAIQTLGSTDRTRIAAWDALRVNDRLLQRCDHLSLDPADRLDRRLSGVEAAILRALGSPIRQPTSDLTHDVQILLRREIANTTLAIQHVRAAFRREAGALLRPMLAAALSFHGLDVAGAVMLGRADWADTIIQTSGGRIVLRHDGTDRLVAGVPLFSGARLSVGGEMLLSIDPVPETVAALLTGRPLRDLIDHPLTEMLNATISGIEDLKDSPKHRMLVRLDVGNARMGQALPHTAFTEDDLKPARDVEAA